MCATGRMEECKTGPKIANSNQKANPSNKFEKIEDQDSLK